MNHDADIAEVSDPRDLTIDAAVDPAAPEIKILTGAPTDDEVAALVAVLSAAGGGTPEPGPQELNPWGRPVEKLRYGIASWQRITLLDRSHLRR